MRPWCGLTGRWGDDGPRLVLAHAAVDAVQVLGWVVCAVVSARRVARTQCAPLWAPAACDAHTTAAAWGVMPLSLGVSAALLLVYAVLWRSAHQTGVSAGNRLLQAVAWAVLHFHFSVAYLVLITSRAMYALWPLCLFAMLQDIYVCVRAAVSSALTKRTSGESRRAVDIFGGGGSSGGGVCCVPWRVTLASSLLWPCVCCASSKSRRDGSDDDL